jgi:hypothetical protein
MTWNGKLGFETQPSTPINITIPDLVYANAFDNNDGAGLDGPQGIMGIQVSRKEEKKNPRKIQNQQINDLENQVSTRKLMEVLTALRTRPHVGRDVPVWPYAATISTTQLVSPFDVATGENRSSLR